jgi:hypothetical protein
MQFDYMPFGVKAIPGIPGSEIAYEPLIQVSVSGPGGETIMPGLVDTGAGLTILPRELMGELGVTSLGRYNTTAAGDIDKLWIGRVDFGLKPSRLVHRWSAVVGFSAVHDRALYGQVGFLDYFTATFNVGKRILTLQRNAEPLPPPVY